MRYIKLYSPLQARRHGVKGWLLRQVKIRVLTLTIAKKYEKNKIYRITDFEDIKNTGVWPKGK
jgi:hypothetical protein